MRTDVSLGSPEDGPSLARLGREFRPQDFPAELRGLIKAVLAVRGRMLANRFLHGWIRWWFWILVGLLVAAALSPKLAFLLIFAATVLIFGAVAVLLRNWGARPSPYEAACRLDSAAGLQDRLSTALYFATAGSPDEMILCQRQDALKHLARVNPCSLFTIRLPDSARRAALLAMAVAGLLVYRVYYRPPVVALLQGVARSQTVQAILNPLKQAVQLDIQKMLSLANQTVDAMNEEKKKEVDASDSHDNLWKPNEQQEAGQDAGQKQGMQGDSENQQGQAGQQTNSQNQDARQQGNQQSSSQNGQSNGTNGKANSQQQQNAGSSLSSHESFTQSLFQELKNLLSSSQNQQRAGNRNSKNQMRPSQGPPQSANSQQSGEGKQGSNRQQSGGAADAQQKMMTKLNGAGAGNQPGYKQMKKHDDAQPAKTQADQVALQNNGSNENLRVRIPAEIGTAKVPMGDASPSGVAAIKGAEQENIPDRYRLYVQRYFEHSNSGAH